MKGWLHNEYDYSKIMKTSDAAKALATLGNDHRLKLLRLVMTAGASGMAAGDIAELLSMPPSTLSTHLRALEEIGLMRGTRIGRSVRYAVHIDAVRQLFAFMTETCCGGLPQRCGSILPAELTNHQTEAPPSVGYYMSEPAYSVLFLCVKNSARSIMAEAIVNKIAKGRLIAFSAGTQPSTTGPRPDVLNLLRSLGHEIDGLHSKDCRTFQHEHSPKLDFVIQLCEAPVSGLCGELGEGPITAAWPLPDPEKFIGRAIEKHVFLNELYGALLRRISVFTSLPLATLDRLTLGRKLTGIGAAVPIAAE